MILRVGSVNLTASQLDLLTPSPTIISLNCTGQEESLTNCTISTSGSCTDGSNAAIRCLGGYTGSIAMSRG